MLVIGVDVGMVAGGVTARFCEASRITECMFNVLACFRGVAECASLIDACLLLRDSDRPDLSASSCKNERSCTPRVAILLSSNLFKYDMVSVTSCLCSRNSFSVGLRCSTSRLSMMAAATEKACSIQSTGPSPSPAMKASRSIVLAAARQVRRVKAKVVLVNDGTMNLRWLSPVVSDGFVYVEHLERLITYIIMILCACISSVAYATSSNLV